MLTIAFGSWKDALFLGILVSNIAIGSFQEIRSKRALDRLAALVAPEAVVVRDGVDRRRAGRPGGRRRPRAADGRRPGRRRRDGADGRRARARRVQPDRRVRAGRARRRASRCGRARSPSRAPALFEATAVGPDSRAARLTATARAFRHPRSPLERANDRLLLWLVALSVPLAIGLAVSVFTRVDTASARVQALTAGIVNLVPEGLILLISLTAAVSAFKVAQRGVLAQQLNAVESLASVDVVCTDKTGTLTEPTLRVVGLAPRRRRRRGRRWRARWRATPPARRRAT